jgi:hypothetical protein
VDPKEEMGVEGTHGRMGWKETEENTVREKKTAEEHTEGEKSSSRQCRAFWEEQTQGTAVRGELVTRTRALLLWGCWGCSGCMPSHRRAVLGMRGGECVAMTAGNLRQ